MNAKDRDNKLKILEKRLDAFYRLLEQCELCPRRCRVNRLQGNRGFCKFAKELYIFSFGPHFGEEEVLVGRYGSGTIFFSGCNLGCVYCQNYTMSHLGEGYKVTERELSDIILSLEDKKCHNINLVTPTHFTPQIMRAIWYALKKGLDIPIVYNCGGYELASTIQMLDGIVDIYMPDIKYWDSAVSEKLSGAGNYRLMVEAALKEMQAQVGDLLIDEENIAYRGLLIRHLVLPNNMSGSKGVFEFISTQISKESFINIMDQYRPCFRALEYSEISRPLRTDEYKNAKEAASSFGLHRGFSV